MPPDGVNGETPILGSSGGFMALFFFKTFKYLAA